MLKHTNPNEIAPQRKATYVVQSYYGQDDSLIEQTKFHICDGQPDNIQNLTCDELKHVLIRYGIWPQFTRRIKNLEKIEREFWKLYDQEVDIEKKAKLLEDTADLQSLVSNCYGAAKNFLVSAKNDELKN